MSNYQHWEDIKGYEGLYQINRNGDIKSCNRVCYRELMGSCILKEKIIKPGLTNGYKRVLLSKESIRTNFFVHRLLAIQFIPNPNNYPCINHIDSNRENNSIENLEWCTYSHNNKHAFISGNQISQKPSLGKSGENTINGKPVLQYDLDGNFIKEWVSATEIMNKLGINNGLISMCCRNKIKKSKGFIWKFKN